MHRDAIMQVGQPPSSRSNWYGRHDLNAQLRVITGAFLGFFQRFLVLHKMGGSKEGEGTIREKEAC